MGAWGHNSFANDSALDWLGALRDGDASLVAEALEAITEADPGAFLDSDEASPALAAAELVAAAHGRGDERLPEDAAKWLAARRKEVARIEIELAHRAVSRVLEESELRELWDENGEDSLWHQDVRELLRRLS